ncbi:MAG: hypothetical protein RO009_08110 [Pseudorhodoplanes sp.]|nr:hypothetical protein [Pseudorhodoplanes sp.]
MSTLDADHRLEARHTPCEAGVFGRCHNSTDILVGARRFLGDATR